MIKLQHTARMLARENTGQKTGYWHNDVFAKIEVRWSGTYHVIYGT